MKGLNNSHTQTRASQKAATAVTTMTTGFLRRNQPGRLIHQDISCSSSSSHAQTVLPPSTPPATERRARGRLIVCIKTDAFQVLVLLEVVAAVVVGVAVGASAGTAAATTTETAAAVVACKPKRKPRVGACPKRMDIPPSFGAFSKMPDTVEDDRRVASSLYDLAVNVYGAMYLLMLHAAAGVYGARPEPCEGRPGSTKTRED